NGFEKVQHYKIKNSGLAPFFDSIFTAEGVGVKKPHPEIFKTALKQTHTNPEQALMIGDSLEADILGALNQGMHAVHFNSHDEALHTHCPIINSLEELTKLL
ncbi:MAG: HAD family hydrolase, partial [Flavobacteriaceae bacterium]